ncbi:CMGC CLK protein kinase [Vararia minispora EC-137]|uniref:CMGC CLK protein kinase n=1 Tax=Vararia minispora EC-137 TaxID=1314806 RepID=A0ACB8QLD4_9AGAM|nr:CMGC CLK protein kinase [Vararia minispora EC-137]
MLNTPPLTTRKRKRAPQYSVSYSEVHEVDQDGRLREVIVIEDTPPPPTASPATTNRTANGYSASYQPPVYNAPIRTRARAAAEAQGLSSSASSIAAVSGPVPKKRKREQDDAAAVSKRPYVPPANPTWPNGAPAGEDARLSLDAPVASTSCDDKEGHYIIREGDIINKRYTIVRLLGQGTFGKVVECLDNQTGQRVAVKVIRAIQKYRDASKIEVRVLNRLKEKDPLNKHKCIHLLTWFDHRNHICLVSELLGMCVYDFLKENDFAPFPRHHIQDFARQLLGSVAFLHDLHLIHTDLKPENILLVHNDYRTVPSPTPPKRGMQPRMKRILESTEIRLIDFGSATFQEEYHSNVVSTRHYRAPEIILGLGWSYPCDAFSLGCILVEFYTGIALFQTHDNLEHLAMMEMVMGKMPDRFSRAGARAKPEYFREGCKLAWPSPKTTRQSKKEVRTTKSLQDIITPTDSVNRQFLDLVRKLLAFDPAERITVREALQHPYFKLSVPHEY